jgi:hypothetical protein
MGGQPVLRSYFVRPGRCGRWLESLDVDCRKQRLYAPKRQEVCERMNQFFNRAGDPLVERPQGPGSLRWAQGRRGCAEPIRRYDQRG